MKNLVKAVLNVMADCEGIDKSLTVGSGRSSYKGVSDSDVKLKIGRSMRKHGLIILPTEIEEETQLSEWEEVDTWSKETPKPMKRKQSIFTKVKTKYRLIHESGEEVELTGSGHGVDPQDKSIGKATTYAMKYTLLYTFMVSTGYIDDADNTHSNEIETKQPPKPKPQSKPKEDKKKEDVFVGIAKKEGGMSPKLASVISKASNEYKWSNEKILGLLKDAGFEDVSEDDIKS